MSDNSLMREAVWHIVDEGLRVIFGLALLAALLLIGRFVFVSGFLPVGLIALSLAVVLSLLGHVRFPTLIYLSTTLAWSAMTIVLIERLMELGFNGWGATVFWILANLCAAASYDSVTENVATGDKKRRAIVFYGLFIAWPATALLVIASGNSFGLSGWVTIGGWAAASFVALAAYAGMQLEAARVQADSDT